MPSAFGLVIIQPFLATATNTLPIGERGLTVETTGMAWFGFSIHWRSFFCQTQVVEGGCHSGESHDCHGAANQVQLIQETKRVIWIGPTHKRDQRLNGPNAIDYKHSFDKKKSGSHIQKLCLGQNSIALYCIVSYGIAWYWIILFGIAQCCILSHGIALWHVVCFGGWQVRNKDNNCFSALLTTRTSLKRETFWNNQIDCCAGHLAGQKVGPTEQCGWQVLSSLVTTVVVLSFIYFFSFYFFLFFGGEDWQCCQCRKKFCGKFQNLSWKNNMISILGTVCSWTVVAAMRWQ